MRRLFTSTIPAFALTAALAVAAPANAQESAQGTAPSALTGGGLTALDDSLLAGQRGGEGQTIVNDGTLMLTSQSLGQENSSRLATGSLRNGDVTVANDAFSNAGMGNYVFTTGSSNNVQAALSINLVVPAQ